MKWTERVKQMIRSWLELQPAPGQSIVIREPVSHETNVLRNQIWYRGDASELDQLFKALADDAVGRARFWAAAPSSESIRKAHSGLPGVMVDTLAAVVGADLAELDFDGDTPAARRWAEIAAENVLPALVGQAVADTLVAGDGAFKISFDTALSGLPILEYWDGGRVEYETRRGRVCEVRFLTRVGQRSESRVGERGRTLVEVYAPGRVEYRLLDAEGRELPLSAETSCEGLSAVTFEGGPMLAVPLRFWPSGRWPGRGRGIFDNKTDAFDAHDEVISQWMDALRAGRVQRYIPENMIPRSERDGRLLMPSRFGSEFVQLAANNRETGGATIDTVQPEIRYEAFLASYTATLDMCLQGIMSPATLGIDLGKMSSAEAQREKKDVTGMTRGAITAALEQALPNLAAAALTAQDILAGKQPGRYEPTVSFGEYGAPDFDSRVRTLADAAAGGIMSVEAQVEELWGSSKDDAWKQAEVRRIRQERGVEGAAEPAVGGLDTPDAAAAGLA